jgi:hypothetical protein
MNLKKKSGMILGRAGVASSHFYKHLLNGGCGVISVIDNSQLRKKLKQIYSGGSCYPCHCISEGKLTLMFITEYQYRIDINTSHSVMSLTVGEANAL